MRHPSLFLARFIITGIVLASAAAAHAAAPVVTSTYPVRHRNDAGRSTPIEVTFDQAIDPVSVTAISFRVFGRWSGPATGTVTVAGATVSFQPAEPFFAGECVTVNVSRAVKNLSNEPMAKGYAFKFWVATANGTLTYTYDGRTRIRQGGETWVQPYGAYGGDLDNDGYSDLAIPCEQTSDVRVMMNNAGTFSTFTLESIVGGSTPSPSEGADFDNDGEIDIVVANTANDKVSLLFGDGTGDFPANRKTSYTCGSSVRGVGVLDLNGDGWDDIVSANRFGNNLSILINNGNGTFAAAVPKETGGSAEFAIATGDANNDGLEDVFCGTFTSPYLMIILLSDGNGGLTAQPGVSPGGRPWQAVAGDFNNDGNMDVATSNSQSNNMGILYGNGSGGFLAAATVLGTDGFPLAIDAGDVDGDGDIELLVSCYDGGTWNLFENVNGVQTNRRIIAASTAGSEAVLHDRDNDGDLDLTGIDEIDDYVYYYTNNGPATAAGPLSAGTVRLSQNVPNPFNPSTTIRFELAEAGEIDLAVFDASGARVASLASGFRGAGTHEARWNGLDERGARVASGVYFYRLSAGRGTVTRKMVLLK